MKKQSPKESMKCGEIRACSHCGVNKHESMFYIKCHSRRATTCKDCTKARARNYYYENREKILTRINNQYDPIANRVKCKQQHAKHRSVRLEDMRRYHMEVRGPSRLKAYGFRNEEHFQEYLKSIHHECEICGTKLNVNNRKSIHCDHDHKTNHFRGILCRGCNHGLGQFQDSISAMEKAIEYLKTRGQSNQISRLENIHA